MSNKTINIISEIVLPAVTAVLTIVLFFMFRPEDSTGLFWLNLVYTVLLEGIFFGYIISLNRKSEIVSVPFKAVFGIYALYYIVAGLAWMLLYSLLLARLGVSIKVDIAVLIILTLLWIILALVTAQADSGYHTGMQEFEDSKKLLNFKIEKMKLLALFIRNFFRVADVAANAPAEAAALPKVPMIMSVCGINPRSSAMPSPYLPRTPNPCASST